MADLFPAPDNDGSDAFNESELTPPGESEFGAPAGDEGVIEETKAEEAQQPKEPTSAPDEIVFDIDGETVPLAKVPPETVKQWYEASSNIQKMAAAHTQRSQELAAQRKAFEEEAGSVRGMMEQLKETGQEPQAFIQEALRWDSYLKSPQGARLLPLIQAYHYGDPQVAALVQQLAGNYVPQVPRQQQADPTVSKLERRLQQLEQNNQLSERQRQMQEAFAEVRKQFPDLDENRFRMFEAEMLSRLDDDKTLMQLMMQAFVGANREEIERKTREQYAKEKADSQKAAVETGGGSPGVTTPENINVDDLTYDQMVEEFAKLNGMRVDY